MKRERNRLTTVGMKALTKPGRHADGAGLYMLVKPDGRRTWVFRWRDRITGKLRDNPEVAFSFTAFSAVDGPFELSLIHI